MKNKRPVGKRERRENARSDTTSVPVDTGADTAFGIQIDAHAWSAADPPPIQSYTETPAVTHSWRFALRRTGMVVLTAASVTGLTLLAVTHPGHATSHADPPAPQWLPDSAAPPPPLPPPDPPPVIDYDENDVAPETPDGQYLTALRRIGLEVYDRKRAIATGHGVCDEAHRSGLGRVALPYLYMALATEPGWTIALMRADVNAAIDAYCPEVR